MPKQTKKGKRAAALSRTRAGSQQANTDSARANAAVEMVLPACITAALPPEILVYVLCRFEGGAKSVAQLCQGAATSKHWFASVKLALANEVWCVPYVAAGEAFVLKLPEFLANATIGPITNDGLTKSCRDFPREMRAFAASKPVQIAAIPTLISIAACATRTIYFGKSLACVLVHVMQAQPHDEEVQQRACEGICTVSPLYQKQLLDAGAVPVMVKAMMRFAPSPKALGALSRMMSIHKGIYGARIAEDVQGTVIDAGVVPLLVTAMTQHQDNRDFIAACVDCLRLLPTSYADLLVQAGVADSLFAILRANSEAAARAASQIDLAAVLECGSLTQKVLELLIAMQKHERYRHIDFFATSAGMEACLAHAHEDKGHIAWNVLTLVEHMTARHTHVMFAVINLGLVPLLLAVLKRGHETAVQAALRLLHKLSNCAQFSPLVPPPPCLP